MTTIERTATALVTYDQCDGCGTTRALEARIGGQRFDGSDRGTGLRRVRVWAAHPWHGKHLCNDCFGAGRHLTEPHPAGMVRISLVEVERCALGQPDPAAFHAQIGPDRCRDRACRDGWVYNEGSPFVPSAPWAPESFPYALLLDDDRALGCVLCKRDGHWVPAQPYELEFCRELRDDGDIRYLVQCEVTARTPFPTVLEVLAYDEDGDARAAGRWGDDVAVRSIRGGGDDGCVEIVRLRVPVEVLHVGGDESLHH